MSAPPPQNKTAIACVVKEVGKEKTVFAYYQDEQGDLARDKHVHQEPVNPRDPIDQMKDDTPLAACFFDNEIFIFAQNTDLVSYQKMPIPRKLSQSIETSKLAASNNPYGQAWVYYESVDSGRSIYEKELKGGVARDLQITPSQDSNLAASAADFPSDSRRNIFYEKENGIYTTIITDDCICKEEIDVEYRKHTALASVYFDGHPRLYFFNQHGCLARTSHIDGKWQPQVVICTNSKPHQNSALGAAVEFPNEGPQIVIYYQDLSGKLATTHDK